MQWKRTSEFLGVSSFPMSEVADQVIKVLCGICYSTYYNALLAIDMVVFHAERSG